MKSQDIIILFKLIAIHGSHHRVERSEVIDPDAWRDWSELSLETKFTEEDYLESCFSVRALADATGISKSQVSLSLNRCYDIGLAKTDRITSLPKTNSKALLEFICYGIRYVFPAKLGELERGISTSIAAPVLRGQLMSSGELPPVWPYPRGQTKGVAVKPLHPNIFKAVANDAALYAMLALTDAIRLGLPREKNLAIDKLSLLFKELQ